MCRPQTGLTLPQLRGHGGRHGRFVQSAAQEKTRGGVAVWQSGHNLRIVATPEDVAATIYTALGVDPRYRIRDRFSRPQTLADGESIQALFTRRAGTRPVCHEAIPELGQVQSPAEELLEQVGVGQCFVEYQQHFVAGTLGTSQRLD